MKKLSIAFGALLLATATAGAQPNGPFDGFYVGGGGSYSASKLNSDQKSKKFNGQVNAGYGTSVDNIYIGGEGVVDFKGFKFKDGADEIKRNYGIGANARVGYVFSNQMLGYGLVGYERVDLKVNDENTSLNGIRYGVGAETLLKENVSFRTEVSQSRMKKSDVKIKDLRTTMGIALRF